MNITPTEWKEYEKHPESIPEGISCKYPLELWKDYEEAWKRVLVAFKRQEQDYVDHCVGACDNSVANLSRFYRSMGANFEDVWVKYLAGKKKRGVKLYDEIEPP